MYKGNSKIPSHADFKFNIKTGTKVKITTTFGNAFYGYVETNPTNTEVGHCISLTKCYGISSHGKKTFLNILRFFLNEIVEVRIIKLPPDKDLSKCVQRDEVRIIDEEVKFKAAILALKSEDCVGFNMFGTGIGRFATIGWVCFYTKGVLVAMDAIALSTDEFWTSIQGILESNLVRKVVYDNRSIEDYLINIKNIHIKNYDDLMALDLDIRIYSIRDEDELPQNDDWVWSLLSQLLEAYIPKKVNEEELNLLEKRQCGRLDSPNYIQRPFKIDVWAKVMLIQMKYLVELKREMDTIRKKKFVKMQTDQMDDVYISGTIGMLNALVTPYAATDDLKNLISDAVFVHRM